MAQLGARFHGVEEVEGSNPSRSTKPFKHLPPPTERIRARVRAESAADIFMSGPAAKCGPRYSSLTQTLRRR